MRLIEALRYTTPTCLTFVGAGGKTTALFQSAREITDLPANERIAPTVLITTSTHLGAWQAQQADHHYGLTSISDIVKVGKELPGGVVLFTGGETDNLLGGLSARLLDEVRRLAEERILPLLIEADGAHGCPLKAPAMHEPAIPEFTRQVVVVAGLGGLKKPLSKDWVHRPEKFAELSGLRMGEEITGEALTKMLLDEQGGLKNIPEGARRCVLLNQADTLELQSQAKRISERLITKYDASIVASLCAGGVGTRSIDESETKVNSEIHTVIEPVAGIILAAGGSSRFGEPKQLLSWKGQPLIRHVALAALQAGLAPVVVVVGSSAIRVQVAIQDLPVRIVDNPEWSDGLSTSIKAGMNSLPTGIGGVVFLQGDQPQIPHTLIRSLVEAHQTGLPPIITPQIGGQRGNPVLFDESTFSKLLSLEGDMGGRSLFSQYSVRWVTWNDAKLLIDIDTPEDYDKFLEAYRQDEVGA